MFQADAALQKCSAAFLFLMMAKDVETVILMPVVSTIAADLLTPLSVYLKVTRGCQQSFLLESVEGSSSVARYSFIGANPRSSLRCRGQQVDIVDAEGAKPVENTMFDCLRSHFSKFAIRDTTDLPPFAGGAIGHIGFDCVNWFEPSLNIATDTSTVADMMFFDSVIAFDHVKQEIKIISLSSEAPGFRTLEDAERLNENIKDTLNDGSIDVRLPEGRNSHSEIESNFGQRQFESAVRKIKELIKAGECYQVVLSQKFTRKTNADAVAIYRALRSLNPSPYMFLLKMDDRSIIGSSPEMLVRSSGKTLEYRPIAGTKRRGDDGENDRVLAEELRADPKEIAEHMMLVDLGRNDLGRVSKFGSVCVEKLMEVEKYSHVQHLVTRLSAELEDGRDRFDAFAACFPAGTVSGAPKVRAIEIIRRLEPEPRGVYAGAIGYFDYGGHMDTCIAIRTIVLKDGVATVQAGAGIVADSIPESEYQETVNKAAAMIKAIEIAEGR